MNTEDLINLVPNIDPKIEDYIELRTQSLNKSNMGVFMDALDQHKKDSLESRALFREQLLLTVEKQMKETVNGKIDKIAQEQKSHNESDKTYFALFTKHNEKMDERWSRMEPAINRFEENEKALKAGRRYAKDIILVGSVIGGFYVIKSFFGFK